MKLHIVDVFAESLYTGNQLAVVMDAAALSTDAMQDIAREMNFSETTFITANTATSADVRIFTPEWELPFAGHPTVGTAWVLTGGVGGIQLNLPVGPVAVQFTDGVGWMTPPPVDLKDQFDRSVAAELVNLQADDLAADYPVQLAEVGPEFVLIGVKDLPALQRAKLNESLHNQLMAQDVGVRCVFVFSKEAYSDLSTDQADYAARMFFNSGGVREDPATGSANTAFAAYLKNLHGAIGNVVVDQGVEINRPSRLYLDIGEEIRVGGRVFPSVSGELLHRG